MTRRLPLVPTLALGVLSIVAFGGWFYGYGVLVEPIGTDTGWSEGLLGGTYGAAFLVAGVAGTAVGHALDAHGSRRTFTVLGVGSTSLLVVASLATNPWVFAVAGSLGGGLVGAGGYYNATSAVMARLVPQHRAHGITVLTLFGAFASPVFLPLLGWVVVRADWRPTLRGIAVAVGVAYLLAAVGVPDVRPEETERPRFRQAATQALAGPVRRGVVVAVMVAGATSAVILVQQIPAMVDAGMALAVASAFAGARGLMQLAGRLPLAPVVERFGATATLRGSYALMGAGALILLDAGDVLQASLYVLVAGVGIGAMSAAESILAADVYDGPSMGTHLGVLGLLRGVGAAIGPTIGGFAVDLTGSRNVTLVLCAVGSVAAALVLRHPPTRTPARGRPQLAEGAPGGCSARRIE